MNRAQLEHVIRAASSIANDNEIVVIGSQAILGFYPEAPGLLCVSEDADVYPRNFPERADLVDGAIGELSAFHDTFGYYAHGVGPETAILPAAWESRLVHVTGPGTAGAVGLCLHPLDIAFSKLVAGRQKDIEYLRVMVERGFVQVADLVPLVGSTALAQPAQELMLARLESLRSPS